MISIQISSVSLAMDLANNGFANTSAAKVPLPEVFAIVNSSVNFSCTSDGGQPLSMCLWERRADGQREMIQMEEEEHAPKVTDKALSDGRLNITVEDLEDGNCTLRIFSVRETDSGRWSCTLVAKGGSAFTGDIYVEGEPYLEKKLGYCIASGDAIFLQLQTHHRKFISQLWKEA